MDHDLDVKEITESVNDSYCNIVNLYYPIGFMKI